MGLSLGLVAAEAAAEVPGLSLSWQAPRGCPTQEQVEQAVLAGRLDRESAPGRQVLAEVRVQRRADGTYVAELTTQAPEGRGVRQLEGESCDAIASGRAGVLARGRDPHPPPAPPPSPPPPPPPPPQPAAPAPLPWVGYAHVFGGGVLRALPDASPLVGLGAGVRRGAWDVELLLSATPSATVQATALPGASATLSLLSVQGIACFAPVLSNTTALEVCAGALYEHLSGASRGVSNPGRGSIGLLSPELGLRSRIRLMPPFHLGLDVIGTARPQQPHFVIGGVGQVHEMPVFDGMFQVGLLLSF